MKHLFVPKDISKYLRDKGMNLSGIYFAYYSVSGALQVVNPLIHRTIYEEDVQAPLYQQVIDWFREKHNIMIWVSKGQFPENYYAVIGSGMTTYNYRHDVKMWRDSYYEALDEAIIRALTFIP